MKKICDHCGKENPDTFEGTNLTKCCSTYRLTNGEWANPTKVFYRVDENTTSIGKLLKIQSNVNH